MKSERILKLMGEIDEKYVEEAEGTGRKRPRRVWMGLGVSAACVALVVAAALALPKLPGGTPMDPDEPSISGKNEPNGIDRPQEEDEHPTGGFIPDVEDQNLLNFDDKYVTPRLWLALDNADGGPVTVTVSVIGDINGDYVYNGMTIGEIRALFEEALELSDKLGQLLKEGEHLKYGEALCTTGAPDGTRYAREFYEERVAFYGELLDLYIVDGEFLAGEVEEAISDSLRDRQYETMYFKALSAWRTEYAGRLNAALADLGFACELSGETVTVTLTRAEFEALELKDLFGGEETWCVLFDTCGASIDPMDLEDIPISW